MCDRLFSYRGVHRGKVGTVVLAIATIVLAVTPPARAQSVQHKPEPWIVSVNHRIDLNAHAQQLGDAANGQNVRVLKPGRGRTSNLASGVLIDSDGHVVTRLVNLDPKATEHDIQITTSVGKILRARFVGFDGPTGLALLSVPELRGTKPAPSVQISPLADGTALRLVSTEYKLSQISVPVERVALYPALLDFPARSSNASLTPSLQRSGVFAIVESAALTSSKDLSSVETTDGRLVGIARFVSVGRAHVLPVPFLRDVVARRIIAMQGNVAAGWLGALGASLVDIPADRRPTWAPQSGVLLNTVSPKGPAAIAGLRPNDCIVGFDAVAVRSAADLSTAVLSTPAGTNVQINVIREGADLTVSTVLGGQPLTAGVPQLLLPSPLRSAELRLAMLRSQLAKAGDAEVRARLESEIRQAESELAAARGDSEQVDAQFDSLFDDRILTDLGLEGQALTDQLSKHFGVSGGIWISRVKSAGIGEQAGLKAADVIVKADGKALTAEDDLAESVLGAARAGRTVLEITILREGKSTAVPIPIGTFRRP